MSSKTIINRYQQKLDKLKGFSRLMFLVSERSKLDDGIFSTADWKDSAYRRALLKMLDQDDIAENLLETYFDDYKERWSEAKKRYFDTTDEIEYHEFMKEFKDQLPQDIFDSIKKTKSTDIESLELPESLSIFKRYHEVREWLKDEIGKEFERQHLTDNEIFLLSQHDKLKFQWRGDATELIGLLEVLESNKWINLPANSFAEKSGLIFRTFTFEKREIKIDSLKNIYKKATMNESSFKRIIPRK